MTSREWLIADGLGGYAMGTEDGIRTRRYHSLLLVAATDSERRFVLVNGVEAWLETPQGSGRLSAQRYAPDVVESAESAAVFEAEPWPAWELSRARHEISGVKGHAATILSWRLTGTASARLRVRPLLSGRDWHALHHENSVFRAGARESGQRVQFTPYEAVPPVIAHSSGAYSHAPQWYRHFQYDEERARGQEFVEDLLSPGTFKFELTADAPEAWLVLTTTPEAGGVDMEGDVAEWCRAARGSERERITAIASPFERAADQFIVQRGRRRTIIAGYPWFTDWGRDTFISVRGLCVATGRLADAESILSSWVDHLSQGMMPNLFPGGAGTPEYNSVDASLWFIIAVHDLARAASGGSVPQVPLKFIAACEEILTQYARGTRHGIRMDSDGLLAAGVPGLALTWMDAIVDGQPVTPRIGKPVEVQALWINALEFAATWNTRWRAAATKAHESFAKRFWNTKRGFLYDVVDVDHVSGANDDRLRPNQIFACGGLPQRVLDADRAAQVFEVVERELWTPLGLRTLGRKESGYVGRVDGPMRQRDLGYHQGTAWPWLSGALSDATHRLLTDSSPSTQPNLPAAFVGSHAELPSHEIADGDEPHTARGCPYQAWTVGELIRMRRQ